MADFGQRTLDWERGTSVRDFLNILFRHKWAIVLFFVFVVAGVTILSYLSAEIFESEAKLLIRLGRENVSTDPTVIGPTVNMVETRENDVNSEIGILRSPLLAEQVVDAFGPEVFLSRPDELHTTVPGQKELRESRRALRGWMDAFNDWLIELDLASRQDERYKAIGVFAKGLAVLQERDSHMIRIRFRARSPKLAKEALDTLIDFYLEHHVRVHRGQASPSFFEQQSSALLDDLKGKEERYQGFLDRNDIAALEEEKSELLTTVSSLERQIDFSRGQIASSRARVISLIQSLDGRSPLLEISRVTGRTNHAADTIKERLIELRLTEADLSARYPSDYRKVVEIREQIRWAEASLAEEEETRTEVTTGLDTTYQEMALALETERAHLAALEARQGSLIVTLEVRRGKLDELVSHEMMQSRLKRESDIAETEYREYRDHLQRARISAALDSSQISNVSVVQPATLAFEPIRPRKLLNISLATIIGALGGIGLAFFLNYLDDSLKTIEEVKKRLDLPVLSSFFRQEFQKCI